MTLPAASSNSKGRLLIIDDEVELREVLIALLENSADHIVEAGNGLEGINILQKQEFDAVLSDERMPKKSGLEVLKWMRENSIPIPFIVHSGYGQKDIIQQANDLGAYAFIDKPWDERALIRTVEEALRAGISINKTKAGLQP
jgi:DNA-binding NtrC family response regulator